MPKHFFIVLFIIDLLLNSSIFIKLINLVLFRFFVKPFVIILFIDIYFILIYLFLIMFRM